MVAEWPTKSIDEVKAPRTGAIAIGPFGSRMKSENYVASGVPVIRGTNIGDTRQFIGDMVYITDEFADDLGNAVVRAGDLVFPHRGSIGQVGIVPRDDNARYVLSTSLMKLTCDPKQVDPIFLFYFFRSDDGRHELLKNASIVGTPGIGQPLTSLRSIRFPCPPLPEQKAIARILGTLDDKIELNRRMNATLEAMARALFQSWFVDFDPVHAKAAGRPPSGMDQKTAALFPATVEDSELGELPRGWQVTTIGDCCERIFSGGTPNTSTASYWDGDVPWLSSGETRSSFIIETEKQITQSGVENSSTKLARSGCTVIASAGQGHTRGQTSLLTFDSYINQSVVALAANPKVSSDLFLFFDLERRYDEFRQLSDSHSSRGSLTTKLLAGVKCARPTPEVIAAFDKAVGPLVRQITANLHHSRTLATLRDTLLPKLLSGELSVAALESKSEAGS